jgi:hypothetical protein
MFDPTGECFEAAIRRRFVKPFNNVELLSAIANFAEKCAFYLAASGRRHIKALIAKYHLAFAILLILQNWIASGAYALICIDAALKCDKRAISAPTAQNLQRAREIVSDWRILRLFLNP